MDWLTKWVLYKEAKRQMKKLLTLEWVKGHRTQIAAGIIAVLTLLLNLGTIDTETYTAVVGFLTSIGLLTASVHKPKPE